MTVLHGSRQRLTTREVDVLRLMAEGLSNRGIAGKLYVSIKSIEVATSSIFMKLDLVDNADDNRRVLAVRRYLDMLSLRRSATEQLSLVS